MYSVHVIFLKYNRLFFILEKKMIFKNYKYLNNLTYDYNYMFFCFPKINMNQTSLGLV